VVSIGSISKGAWGGLRIGWLRAPAPLVERAMHFKLVTDLGDSVPALVEAVGQATGRERADFPDWRLHDPKRGSVLRVELPVEDTGPFCLGARRHGVHVAPGSAARAEWAPDRTCASASTGLAHCRHRPSAPRAGVRDHQKSPGPVLG